MRWLALLFLLSFYSDLSDNRTLFDLFPDLPSLQCKDHIRGSFKESDALFPAHPAAAVLQADKLLLHLPPAVWTDFVARAHCFSPVLQSNVLNDKLEFMSMQTQSHQAHCLSFFSACFLKTHSQIKPLGIYVIF